jgi:hypothetical protein
MRACLISKITQRQYVFAKNLIVPVLCSARKISILSDVKKNLKKKFGQINKIILALLQHVKLIPC